jgi:hypothetical protein
MKSIAGRKSRRGQDGVLIPWMIAAKFMMDAFRKTDVLWGNNGQPPVYNAVLYCVPVPLNWLTALARGHATRNFVSSRRQQWQHMHAWYLKLLQRDESEENDRAEIWYNIHVHKMSRCIDKYVRPTVATG